VNLLIDSTRLGVDGQPKTNQYGLQLLYCNRGTNNVENDHKQYVTTFGTWHTGIQMSDCLLAEQRHRHNQQMSERYLSGLPRLGHYDSWKVDLLQILVQKNHDRLLYPYWVNASNFCDTPESFNTVALHLSNLDDALKAIRVRQRNLEKCFARSEVSLFVNGYPHSFLAMAWHGRGKTIFEIDANTAGRIPSMQKRWPYRMV
jgi:hypothetical protein